MDMLKVIIITVVGAILIGVVVGMIISSRIKKRKDPNYKPVLGKLETILCLLSVIIGTSLILTGVFLPSKTTDEEALGETEGYYNEEGEFVSGTTEGGTEDSGDANTTETSDATGGETKEEIVVEDAGAARPIVIY